MGFFQFGLVLFRRRPAVVISKPPQFPIRWIKNAQEAKIKSDGKPAKEDDEEDDKPKLDVWHWQDPLLQPQQLLQAEQERRRNYVAVYDLRTRKIVQLADKDFPSVSIDRRSTADIAVGVTNMPYRKMLSWDVPGFQDSYLVNLKTGERDHHFGKEQSESGTFTGGQVCNVVRR